jgi:hypothetical protein
MSDEFEIQFNDQTLIETEGEYPRIVSLMKEESERSGVLSRNSEWMIRSRAQITNMFGISVMTCHFYSNGKVYISEYLTSNKDIHTTDVRCLTYWCSEKGWKVPEPLPVVVDGWIDFWKKEWETYIIDSEYLSKKFGERKEMYVEKELDEDDEELEGEED